MELGRIIVQFRYNQLEPNPPDAFHYELEYFNRDKRSSINIDTLFGPVRLTRWYFRNTCGGKGKALLDLQLGLLEKSVTPALAFEIGQLAADIPQNELLRVISNRFNVSMSVGRLRKITAAIAEGITPHILPVYRESIVAALEKAFASTGPFEPVLTIGRDGVTLCMREKIEGSRRFKCVWKEASVATFAVYDRNGERVKTFYLGRVPEFHQATLSLEIKGLIEQVLAAWSGPMPRLHYVTDAGGVHKTFFRDLEKMRHPVTGERLSWTWCVDYFHAAERITTIANALFTDERQAASWAAKQRKNLLKSNGVSRVLWSAAALIRHHGFANESSRAAYQTARNYLDKYRKQMNYCELKKLGKTIGSGVTEAACKTIVNGRLKQSGMRWTSASAQSILTCRTVKKSGLWKSCFSLYIKETTRYLQVKIDYKRALRPNPPEKPSPQPDSTLCDQRLHCNNVPDSCRQVHGADSRRRIHRIA